MATKLEASRLLTRTAAERKQAGERCDVEAGMAKLFASETAFEVATEAMRIHGGVGYTTELPVERYYRDAPLMIIGEGTNEIQRLVIARGLLARRGKPALEFAHRSPNRVRYLLSFSLVIERMFVYAHGMETGGAEHLRARHRCARRRPRSWVSASATSSPRCGNGWHDSTRSSHGAVAELDTSVEWSVDGSRSTASWLVRNFRLATGEAHHRVRVACQMAQMPVASAAWQEGRISSRHVDVLTSVRHAANVDAEFAAFEQYLVGVALVGRPEDGRGRRPPVAGRARRLPRP